MFSKKHIGIIITIIGVLILIVRAFLLRSTEFALITQIIGIILFLGGGLLIPDVTGDHKEEHPS